MTAPRYWTPLMRGAPPQPGKEQPRLVAQTMEHYGIDRAAAIRFIQDEVDRCEYWLNDLYQVEVRRHPEEELVHLNVRRRDGAPIHDWRHLQQIKNELVGEECEAFELYPAESRLTDTGNKYHLWACTDPTFRFPVGFTSRDVQDGDMKKSTPSGLRQRPF